MKLNELNQQVASLQEENEKVQSLTMAASNESCHESGQEVQSSIEYQLEDHSSQPPLLQKELKELESELLVVRSTLEDERKKHEEKLKELEQQSSINQVKLHGYNLHTYVVHM